jgi:hypothetical protein
MGTRSNRRIITPTGIPKTTLFRWRRTWESARNWRPWARQLRGVTRRIFAVGEEAAISEFIRHDFIRPGRLSTDKSFKACAMQAFLSKHQLDSEIPPFHASHGAEVRVSKTFRSILRRQTDHQNRQTYRPPVPQRGMGSNHRRSSPTG